MEKLMSVREEMTYHAGLVVRVGSDEAPPVEVGVDSVERDAHSTRIHDILGCYYTHVT